METPVLSFLFHFLPFFGLIPHVFGITARVKNKKAEHQVAEVVLPHFLWGVTSGHCIITPEVVC